MSTKSTDTTLRFLVIALAILLVSLGIYTFKFYNEVQENEAQLLKEKALIIEELDEEIERYNLILKENTAITAQLETAKTEILSLQKQLEGQEVTRDLVQRYQLELRKLRREREVFFTQNDSLLRETQRLSELQQRTQEALDRATRQQDSIIVENKTLNIKVGKGELVTAGSFSARGVIQRNNGRFTTTARAKRTEMIQVNYQVNENKLIAQRDLVFYTQVKGPNGQVIGTPREIASPDGTIIKYNNRIIIPYKNETYKISELILGRGDFDEGTYTITVFHNTREVLSGALNLK
ncbi:hypothetical protein EAX61_10440 [Dokdonia sinensis]|uniref:Chromosome partitioning protein ParA n=1 Tax=Dokdonia sinensis TaxID=2479847 RepID=A0A3M0G067_9FLAO|nr:hypothetical protein [Dokdonia sinensis]RMB58028.1 hypothetical protein EAX61_10440 [Dokdonia sinensis]